MPEEAETNQQFGWRQHVIEDFNDEGSSHDSIASNSTW